MYKQCFELLTAQGPKPHKSFSVASGSAEVAKEYDAELKSNIFSLSGQRIQLPPNPSQQHQTDFHNTGAMTKKTGVASSLNVVHQFLIFQVFVPTGCPFQIELHVRDKHNTRRRLMICDGTKNIVQNNMHARLPNGIVARDRWTNVCIDVNSFVKECFSRNSTHGTPQVQGGQPLVGNQRVVGGGSGDIAALHSGKVQDIQISKVAAVMAKNAQQQANNQQNSVKTIEIIQLEGSFKIRKIFTSRSQIPADLVDNMYGANGASGLTGNTMRAQDIIQAAMVGQRIEPIPKNFDYGSQVDKVNQVLSFETVSGFSDNQARIQQQQQSISSENDPMMVTGLRMTSTTQNNINHAGATGSAYAFQPSNNEPNPMETYQVDGRVSVGATPTLSGNNHSNYLQPGSIKSGSALKVKNSGGFRGSSNDRKSSVGGDSNSPFPEGGIVGNTLGLNSQQLNASFRKGNNASRVTQSSVVVVDQEDVDQVRQEQGSILRNSGVSIRQKNVGGAGGNSTKHMKIQTPGLSNATGDTIFKQVANSTTSNHGKSSNQTQSTAYSVRTTSSGRQQQKGKLASGTGGPAMQTSQSPFTDHNSGSGTNNQGSAFQGKRSLHANNGLPVYEQVDEMEESGSGQISLKLTDQQNSAAKDSRVSGGAQLQMSSPSYTNVSAINAQSAKVQRKGFPKTQIDAGLDKVAKNLDPQQVTTPKLHVLQEVHKMTILEENETMRGSMDRYPGSKLSVHPSGSQSHVKKYNRVSQIEGKKGGNSTHQSAAGARKAAPSNTYGKNVRTKSSVGGATISEQANNTSSSIQHPLVKGKVTGAKVSHSSSNLEDSIGGIVGSKIQNRTNASSRRQNNNQHPSKYNAISPNLVRKTGVLPKNQLQLSNQKKRGESEKPQFKVRNGNKHMTGSKSNVNNHGGANNNSAAQFIYNGTAYGSNHNGGPVAGLVDSDGEQSDFKTTTLRFTNNNFINNETQRRERDNSTGAVGGNRESSNGPTGGVGQYSNMQHPNNNNSLLNTLSSQNNPVTQHIATQQKQSQRQSMKQMNKFRNNSKQFGTQDNFKAAGGVSTKPNYDQRTDGFSRLQNNQSKSPVNNRQFSTMHGMLQSEGGGNNEYEDEDEEEQIEEDICDNRESPLINAHTKQTTGQKAKVLFHNQQPPAFRSTESERFNMDTMMTGFGQVKQAINNPNSNATPVPDKSSVLGIKPYLGGKPRHQLIRSPERSTNNGFEFNSAGGDLRPINQTELQKEIEEEIGVPDGSDLLKENANMLESGNHNTVKGAGEVDPNETCTSDFYQVPIQGGIPVQLTIENGRRPFTPPFAQLIRVNKGQTGGSSRSGQRAPGANKKAPEWISTASVAQQNGVMSSLMKDQLKKEIVIQEGNEELIEEDIQATGEGPSPSLPKNKANSNPAESNKATAVTQQWSDNASKPSRNSQEDPYHTFALPEEQIIEFSESFKKREGVKDPTLVKAATQLNAKEMLDPSGGSASHTFGRRSRAQADGSNEKYEDDFTEEDLTRENSKPAQMIKIQQQQDTEQFNEDVIDPQTVDQKKRLLYDKSLKAYYDPETGQYFEMKQQMIPQASLSKLDVAPTSQ